MTLVRDVANESKPLWVALAVAAAVIGLPYGYLVGLVAGTLIVWGVPRMGEDPFDRRLRHDAVDPLMARVTDRC